MPIPDNLTGAVTSVGNATLLGSFTTAQLLAAVTGETGTGAVVFGTSPTLVSPALGTPASGVVTNLTGTASININGTVGATTPATGAFTTLSATGNLTVSGGTVNLKNGTTTFLPATSDASDTGAIVLAGGGASNSNRGAILQAYGNEATTVGGNAYIDSGTTASSSVNVRSFAATGGTVNLQINGGASATLSGTGLAVTGTLSTTGVSTFPAGTVALPSITTTADTNTGIYFPAANTIAFTEGGAEAMRIDSGGNLNIGTTSTLGKTTIIWDNSAQQGITLKPTTATYNGGPIQFLHSTGTQSGAITQTSTSVSYTTGSDYRLKENNVSINDGITRVKQLTPYRFNFIAEPDKTVDGFYAHEVQDIVPEAITGTKDAMRTEEYEVTPAVLDDDDNVVTEAVMGTREVPDYQGIDQSKLVPLLTAALQEAIQQIETLTTRIEALENA
jgi:hypothetical protein